MAVGMGRVLPLAPSVVPGLDELAADPARAKDVPDELVAVLHSRCLLALNALWSRQLEVRAPAPPEPPLREEPDTLLTIEQAAERLSKTRDWLYRHARHLPFTVRVGGHLRFSARGIARFIRERAGVA
jgi:hypothetical protein